MPGGSDLSLLFGQQARQSNWRLLIVATLVVIDIVSRHFGW